MSKFGVLLMLVCFSVSQVLSSAIPNHDHHSHGQFLNVDEDVTEVIPNVTTTTAAHHIHIHASKSDFIQLGEHSYYFSTTTASFEDAFKACQSIETVLAHPRNSLENSKLTQYIRENKKTAIGWWIGATDGDDEGQWVWAHDKSPVDYTDRLRKEPNYQYDNEDCARLRRFVNYKWNDEVCENKYHYICQSEDSKEDSHDVSSSEEELEEAKQCAPNTTENFAKLGDNRYYFSCTEATFDDASKACLSLDAEFAHPMNEEENSQLTNYIRNMYKHDPRGWWIGARLGDNDQGEWVWAHDNSRVGYGDWSIHESHESHENENCAFYGRKSDYKWNDVPCGNKYHYICQYPKLNASQLELPSGGVQDTSEEDSSEEEDTAADEVVTTGVEVEAEIEENTEQMLLADGATWKLNGWCYAVMIACAFITQTHIAF